MKDSKFHMVVIIEHIDRLRDIVGENAQSALEEFATEKAVERILHIISDSTKFLDEAEKEKYPGISWKAITGFRNVIVHDYLGIDRATIVDVIEQELPKLRKAVEDMLENHG